MSKKKLITVMLLIAIVILNPGVIAVAQEPLVSEIKIMLNVGSQRIWINGMVNELETVPYIKNDITLVPVRFIAEAFKAKVDWDEAVQTITFSTGDKVIQISVDNKEAYVNGQPQTMQLAPEIISGRTMVPLRFISENFDALVEYEPQTQAIIISKSIFNYLTIDNKEYGYSFKYPVTWSKFLDAGQTGGWRDQVSGESILVNVNDRLPDYTIKDYIADVKKNLDVAYGEKFEIIYEGLDTINGRTAYLICLKEKEQLIVSQLGIIGNKHIYHFKFTGDVMKAPLSLKMYSEMIYSIKIAD